MSHMISKAKRFLADESGPTTTEYAVMLTLVLFVVLGAVTGLGATVTGVFASADAALGGS